MSLPQVVKALSPRVILSDREGANATEGESKDPENLSCTMSHQGILSMVRVPPPVVWRAWWFNAKPRASKELPERALQRKHFRGPSTSPRPALRDSRFAQDDRLKNTSNEDSASIRRFLSPARCAGAHHHHLRRLDEGGGNLPLFQSHLASGIRRDDRRQMLPRYR